MEDTDVTTNPRMFPALRLMERTAVPTLYNRPPYWRPAVPAPAAEVLIPSWHWRHVEADTIPDDDTPVTLDYNGAYLAAIGSVEVAHGELKHYGTQDPYQLNPRKVLPGYYRVEVPYWGLSGTLVSPLGDSARLETETSWWIAHPTLVLLLELLAEGAIGELEITDSYCSEKVTNFRKWSAKLKDARTRLLDDRDAAVTDDERAATTARYSAFKEGYGAALSMMLTGERSLTRRPDWAHAVYAQHAATSWRKAWRFTLTGPVLAMGAVDEITVFRRDLDAALVQPKPPVKLDESGRALGHLKTKTTTPPAGDPEGAPELLMSEDWSDLL